MHCSKLHFKRVIQPWTDPSLGNCSYLDTCRNMRNCKYIHYIIDDDQADEHRGPTSAQQLITRSKAKVPSYLQVCCSIALHAAAVSTNFDAQLRPNAGPC